VNKPPTTKPEPALSPEDARKKFLEQCSRGGRNGKHEDKVRAGKAGYAARLRKLQQKTQTTNTPIP